MRFTDTTADAAFAPGADLAAPTAASRLNDRLDTRLESRLDSCVERTSRAGDHSRGEATRFDHNRLEQLAASDKV